jgi:hypothetical protein
MKSRFETIYAFFNGRFFDGRLAKVAFEIKPKRLDIFEFRSPSTIEIGRGILEAEPRQILDQLLHCMVHVSNFQQGRDDRTGNQYHKGAFKMGALAIGLTVVRQPNRGWSKTFTGVLEHDSPMEVCEPSDEVRLRLEEAYNHVRFTKKDVRQFRSQMQSHGEKPKRKYLLKYCCRCPVPGNTIRSGRRPDGGRPLDITCNLCRFPFVICEK